MAKTKTPFFSLGAHGSVGEAITAQKRGVETLLREKPLPTDPRSLNQMYQRWLYEDYAYRWRQQSAATQQEYRSAGVRFHLTGFQYWMKYQLKNLPDLGLFFHLDEKAGAVAHDFSRNATNGVIFGASPADGLIDGAQYFTLNDYIEVTSPQLDFTSGDFSILAMLKVDSLTASQGIFIRGGFQADGYRWQLPPDGSMRFDTNQAGAQQITDSAPGTISVGNWYAVALIRAGANVTIFLDGVDDTLVPGVHLDPLTCARTAKIGIHDNLVVWPFDGIIDHLIVFNRAIDITEIKRHSERRYP